MSSRKNRRKHASQWADVDGGYALIIPYTLIRHPNFTRLSPHAVKLVIDLARQYSGYNNGYLCAAWTLMKDQGWRSRGTLGLAVTELEHYRVIERTKQGGRHLPNLYALSWWRISAKAEKPLDVSATLAPSNAWKQDRPAFDARANRVKLRGNRKNKGRKNVLSYTPRVSHQHAQRASGDSINTPSVSPSDDRHATRVSRAVSG